MLSGAVCFGFSLFLLFLCTSLQQVTPCTCDSLAIRIGRRWREKTASATGSLAACDQKPPRNVFQLGGYFLHFVIVACSIWILFIVVKLFFSCVFLINIDVLLTNPLPFACAWLLSLIFFSFNFIAHHLWIMGQLFYLLLIILLRKF